MTDVLICVTFEGEHLSNRIKVFDCLGLATEYAWSRLTDAQKNNSRHCFDAIIECQRVIEDRWTAVVFDDSEFRIVFSTHILNSDELYQEKEGGRIFNT